MTKYTRTENNLVIAATFVCAVLFLIFVSDDPPVPPDGVVPPMWVDLVLAAGFAVLAVRSLRGGAYVGEESLQIRNVFRTHVLPWSEVAGFSNGLYRIWRYPSADVVLKSGRPIRVTMLAPPNPAFRPNNRQTEVLLGGLRNELAGYQRRSTVDRSE